MSTDVLLVREYTMRFEFHVIENYRREIRCVSEIDDNESQENIDLLKKMIQWLFSAWEDYLDNIIG